MNFYCKVAAMATLSACVLAAQAEPGRTAPPARKTAANKRVKKSSATSVQAQIQALRRELEGQIDGLKTDLAEKDAQLRKAQQAAAAAEAAAARMEAASAGQQQAVRDNAAVSAALQSTVTGLKTDQESLARKVSEENAQIKKAVYNPGTLHYKGIEFTPGGFIVADTVYRSKATGGGSATSFGSLPYEHATASSLSEFYGSARPSRISLLAEGKTSWGTLRGYYEADFMGTGVNSNNNQSNSYVLRQRVLYAQAETHSGWKFAGGQMWSLATESRRGISSAPSDILTPQTIDPNYVPGFIWARQYGFRVVKSFDRMAFGVAIENPQLLYTATLAGNTPYAVLGSAGSGMYNAAVSGCSSSTLVVNYTNQAESDSAGNTVNIAVPVYKTVSTCTNLSNISFNKAPDVLFKAAFDPGFGHYEVFGIGGFAHETVYPGETTGSNLYGGLKDIKTGLTVAPALTTAGAYSNSIVVGGVGGSLRLPVLPHNKLIFGAKGLYGPGVGRYSASTLSDVTADAAGRLVPIHNASALLTLEAAPSSRLLLWVNYGGDYAGREDYSSAATTTLSAPTAAQDASGVWGGAWAAPKQAAVGYGSRLLNNASCNTTTAPGYSGASGGYYASGSCGAQTRYVQEVTGGYWYDIYKGDRGRLRQGAQYGYAIREGWSGASGIGARGDNHMFWTTFRYYLP